MRACELAEQIVHAEADALYEQAQTPTDPEHIHQARVASRRLRAALRVFKDLLPAEAEPATDDLKWIAQRLGAVRDLDVQIARLQTNAEQLHVLEPIAPFAAWLEAQRAQALTVCTDALASAQFAQLAHELQHVSPRGDEQPLEEYAPPRLRQAAKKLRKRANALHTKSSDTDYHQVRIRAKRLRYTCEFFEPLYGKRARKVAAACTALQDLLGDQQDGIVATRHIHAAIQTAAAAWSPETALALGQLVQWEADHRAAIRREFKRTYSDVNRAWSKLGKSLE